MVWGYMAASGVGELVFIEGNMDKCGYLYILQGNLKKRTENLNVGENYYFQHDSDPKHTAEIVRLWLLYSTPHTLKAPVLSADLNPIEHLLRELEDRTRRHHISSKSQLKELLLTEWHNIGAETTRKLVQSMPKRLREVIYRRDWHTKY